MSYPWGKADSASQGEQTLDPTLDIVFFMLFAAERNRGLLKALLEAVLCPAAPIEHVELLHPEPERGLGGDKEIALDLRVRLQNGEEFDIEMQSRDHSALRERVLYYWSRMYSGQLARADTYDELRRCAVILFTNFSLLRSSRLHSIFRLQEQHSAELLSDQIEVHVIELPKLVAGGKLEQTLGENDEPKVALWARFLTASSDAEREALADQDPVMKQAKEALETLSQDRAARVQAEMRETALRAHRFVMAANRREGRVEGMAEGRAEGRAEGMAEGRAEGMAEGRAEGLRLGRVDALRRVMELKFGALPPSVATRLLSASGEELERALSRVLTAATPEGVFDSE